MKKIEMKTYYRLSTNKRKYSPDPIVKVTVDEKGREEEEIVLIPVMKKDTGDKFSAKIVELLNQSI
jgi:hypothetical protein